MSEQAREGPNDRKRDNTSCQTGLLHTGVNKGERKAEASRGDPRHIMESDKCLSLPLCWDEPQDDTDNPDENRALAH